MPKSFHSAYSRAHNPHSHQQELDEASDQLSDHLSDHEQDPTVVTTEQHGLCLALDVSKKSQLGFAWFDSVSAKISILDRDILLSQDFFQLELVKAQLGDSLKMVLLSSRIDDFVADHIQAAFQGVSVEFLAPSSFNAQNVNSHLEDLLGSLAVDNAAAGNPVSVSCTVALYQKCPAETFSVVSLQGLMKVTSETLDSLDVINFETHPSHKQSGSKSGLSLHSILDNTFTSVGSRRLAVMIRQPLTSVERLNERLDAVENLMSLPQPILKEMEIYLKKCTDCYFIQSGRLWNTHEWFKIYQFVVGLCGLFELEDYFANCSAFQELFELDQSSLNAVGQRVQEIVDFEASSIEKRVVVKYGIDDTLDDLKQAYDNLDNLLSQKAMELKVELPEELCNKFRVVYFPQLGFLVCFEKSAYDDSQQWFHDVQWSVQFSTDISVYLKNSLVAHLDETVGDIHHIIIDREIEILVVVQQDIATCNELFEQASDCVASLDCYLSLAIAAQKNRYVRPTLSEGKELVLKEARHPLYEHVTTNFVHNNTDISEEKRFSLITGPNASGKSMYVRQVGLIVYMAQIGSFVPCEEATIGIVDAIFTRIVTKESSSDELSAFMIDCQLVKQALTYATNKSLILWDEFGKGTATSDGIGLLVGSLDFLNKRGARALTSTHFYELFEKDCMPADLEESLVFQHMQVIQDEADNFAFLYKLAEGKCTNSLGCYCAELAGIPEAVIKRAKQVSLKHAEGEMILPADETAAAKFRLSEEVARDFSEAQFDSAAQVEEFLKSVTVKLAQ